MTPPNTRFGEKLSALPTTIRAVLAADHSPLANALTLSAGRTAVAVGSGGSAITGSYFSRCRETLSHGVTLTLTPAEFTVGIGDLDDIDIWLFSAGADNPDFRAALRSARARRARRINVLTRRMDAVEALRPSGIQNFFVHVVPVTDEKDSFLATHSMISSVAALFAASNLVAQDPADSAMVALETGAIAELGDDFRRTAAEGFASLSAEDTLLIVTDPQVAPIASLLETSAWEASLCAVQKTDFRNFAHGRHTWLHHRPDRTLVLALTGDDTREAWRATSELLPRDIRQLTFDFGNCGRFRNAVGLVQGLVWVEAMGQAVGIDPGKPGIGEFGRTLYTDDSLEKLARDLRPAIRQKRRAKLDRDDPTCTAGGIHKAGRERLARLSSNAIGGIVLDYDGTIVTTERRGDPPSPSLVDEFKRLHEAGVRIGIATGRGGSAGERLREVFPTEMQAQILMGYYNGGYLRPLETDIREDLPDAALEIVQTAAWLVGRPDLFSAPFGGGHSRVQVTVYLNNVPDVGRFYREIENCEPVAGGAVKIVRSGHSLDIVPVRSSKVNVAQRLELRLPDNWAVLRIGDQGALGGNDNEFLTHPFGISVRDVCGRDEGCWSLFGPHVTGPDALLRLLKALKPDARGKIFLDTESLDFDQ